MLLFFVPLFLLMSCNKKIEEKISDKKNNNQSEPFKVVTHHFAHEKDNREKRWSPKSRALKKHQSLMGSCRNNVSVGSGVDVGYGIKF